MEKETPDIETAKRRDVRLTKKTHREHNTREVSLYIRIDLKRHIEKRFGSVTQLAEACGIPEATLRRFLSCEQKNMLKFKILSKESGLSLHELRNYVGSGKMTRLLERLVEKCPDSDSLKAWGVKVGIAPTFLYRMRDQEKSKVLALAESVSSKLGITIDELCIGPIKPRH